MDQSTLPDEHTYVYFPYPEVNENNLVKFSSLSVHMEFNTFINMLNHIISKYIVDLDGTKFQIIKSNSMCEINSDFEGFKISAYKYIEKQYKFTSVYKPQVFHDINIKDIGLDEGMLQIARDNYAKYVIMCKFNQLKELTQQFLNTQTTFDNVDKYQKIIAQNIMI